MKSFKKNFYFLILLSILVPQITFAAWWNPLTWNIFKFLRNNQVEQTIEVAEKLEDAGVVENDKKIETAIKSDVNKQAPKPIQDSSDKIGDNDSWQFFSTSLQKSISIPTYNQRLSKITQICNYIENDFKINYPFFNKYPHCSDGTYSNGVTKTSYLIRLETARQSKSETQKLWEEVEVVFGDKIKNEKTSVNTINLNNQYSPVTISCRPESWKIAQVPTLGDGGLNQYVQNIITSNAKVNELEAVRLALINYKDRTIDASYDSWNNELYNDDNGDPISYSPSQLNAIDNSMGNFYDEAITYYDSWIRIMTRIINDKKSDGCIDGTTVYDYN